MRPRNSANPPASEQNANGLPAPQPGEICPPQPTGPPFQLFSISGFQHFPHRYSHRYSLIEIRKSAFITSCKQNALRQPSVHASVHSPEDNNTLCGTRRMTEHQPPRDPLRMFTFAGRLLVLATVLVVGGMFYFFVMFVNDKVESGILPSGHYSVAFLLIPGVIVAVVLFVIVSFILELVGVRIWRQSDNRDHDA
jgi:hypothetical protein